MRATSRLVGAVVTIASLALAPIASSQTTVSESELFRGLPPAPSPSRASAATTHRLAAAQDAADAALRGRQSSLPAMASNYRDDGVVKASYETTGNTSASRIVQLTQHTEGIPGTSQPPPSYSPPTNTLSEIPIAPVTRPNTAPRTSDYIPATINGVERGVDDLTGTSGGIEAAARSRTAPVTEDLRRRTRNLPNGSSNASNTLGDEFNLRFAQPSSQSPSNQIPSNVGRNDTNASGNYDVPTGNRTPSDTRVRGTAGSSGNSNARSGASTRLNPVPSNREYRGSQNTSPFTATSDYRSGRNTGATTVYDPPDIGSVATAPNVAAGGAPRTSTLNGGNRASTNTGANASLIPAASQTTAQGTGVGQGAARRYTTQSGYPPNVAQGQTPTDGGDGFLYFLALFASIGLNVYLAWVAWDTYNRYQELVSDVRYSSPRRSSSQDRSYSERELADSAAY